jgi:hypothetical protein
MLAPSVQIVMDGAGQLAAKALYAQLAKVWDVHRRIWIRPWESRIQWMRERRASSWINQLIPGMILRRSYAGKWWTVKVHRHAYQFQGCMYPTLVAVTSDLFAQVPARHRTRQREMAYPSVVSRFWCLPKLLSVDRGQVPQVAEQEVRRLLSRF